LAGVRADLRMNFALGIKRFRERPKPPVGGFA
jgi:hypothetical protein